MLRPARPVTAWGALGHNRKEEQICVPGDLTTICSGGGQTSAPSDAPRSTRPLKRTLHHVLTAIVALVASVALAVPSVYAATAGDADGVAAQIAGATVGDGQGQDAADNTAADGTADAGSAADGAAADTIEGGDADADSATADETVRYDAVATIADGKDVTVHVDAPTGALPDGVTLEASPVGDQDAVASTLDGAGVDYDGFVALDVRFVDASGNEVEPGFNL